MHFHSFDWWIVLTELVEWRLTWEVIFHQHQPLYAVLVITKIFCQKYFYQSFYCRQFWFRNYLLIAGLMASGRITHLNVDKYFSDIVRVSGHRLVHKECSFVPINAHSFPWRKLKLVIDHFFSVMKSCWMRILYGTRAKQSTN